MTGISRNVSRLVLGTVQFGQEYGIANTRGRVPGGEVCSILEAAARSGIRFLDTAAGYGESEECLGAALAANPASFRITSKMPPLADDRPGRARMHLQGTLKRLRRGRIYAYLVHRFADYQRHPGIGAELQQLKREGLVEKIGFSLYCPQELMFLLENRAVFDIVQFPYSIFDRRFEALLPLLKRRNVTIQARSVFLQGVACLTADELPPALHKARGALACLQELAVRHRLPATALCLGGVLSNQAIDQVLIGVDSLDHLERNIDAAARLDRVAPVLGELEKIGIEDEDILLPFKWNLAER